MKKWIVGTISLIPLALAICVPCFYISDDVEKIKALISAVSAYAVSGSLLLNAYSIFNQAQERKLDETFRVIKRWDDEHFMKARDHTRKHQDIQKDKGTKAIVNEIEEKKKLKRSVIMVLNYFEYIESSIKHKRIDEDIVMGFFDHTIQDILDRYQGYIKKLENRNPSGTKQLRDLKVRVDSYIKKYK